MYNTYVHENRLAKIFRRLVQQAVQQEFTISTNGYRLGRTGRSVIFLVGKVCRQTLSKDYRNMLSSCSVEPDKLNLHRSGDIPSKAKTKFQTKWPGDKLAEETINRQNCL